MNELLITKDLQKRNTFVGVIFIVITATIAHLLFSHLGFNPTDDGFVLAGSRRIIEGQVPHRDFIWFHTTGSLFIHAPFVLFGGDYVFLISRYFVWIQFATIAWTWTIVITRSFKVFLTLTEKFAVTLISFSFSVNFFPIMAWHTIDGLFFVSLGILLCDNEPKWEKIVGYILIGTAPLCKQVFLPMIPVSIMLFNDWRQLDYWITTNIPIIIYGIYLAIYRAIPDAILQLTTHKNFMPIGVISYVNDQPLRLGIVVGCLIAFMLSSAIFMRRSNVNVLVRFFGILIVFGIVFGTAWTLANGNFFGYLWAFHFTPAFGIFGVVTGLLLYFLLKERKLMSYSRCGLLVIFVAWCSSLSIGHNTPDLVTGPLLLFLITAVQFSYQLINGANAPDHSKNPLIRWILSARNLNKINSILVIILVVSSLVAFGIARQKYIYREQPASQLTYDLGDVLPGAKGIKTNKNTYDFFRDLQNAKNIAKEKGKTYCIIPDMAAYWVKDSQRNPLPSDWPQDTELARKELLDRATGDLEKMRGTIIVIVQKYEASCLANGFVSLSESYAIVNYVHSNFDKMGETQYFELYE